MCLDFIKMGFAVPKLPILSQTKKAGIVLSVFEVDLDICTSISLPTALR